MSIFNKEKILNKNIGLNEWLNYMRDCPREAPLFGCCFPSDNFEKKFLLAIDNISQPDIYQILNNFLVPTTVLGCDKSNWIFLMDVLSKEKKPDEWLLNHPYFKRLMLWSQNQKNVMPWEGIKWVLELLPDHPNKAIESIENYLIAHFSYLPDWPISGLIDAMEIIRVKFIGVPGNEEEKLGFLLERTSREFEHIVERLYNSMGYETVLTKITRDGGKDVIATRADPGRAEKIAVECKLYTNNVGVSHIRAMRGTISYGNYNKGVIFTTKDYTRDAKKLASTDHALELVTGENLIALLNENFGINWPYKIDEIIFRSKQEQRV